MINLKKINEFLPYAEFMLEEEILNFECNENDIFQFIVDRLHFFESDAFLQLRKNLEIVTRIE